MTGAGIPARIGPAEFGTLGRWITVRCPCELAPLVRQAGGMWEPVSQRWLIEQRRIGPLIRNLRRVRTRCSGRRASIWTRGEGARRRTRVMTKPPAAAAMAFG
jgi:hypothetical protein